jgi:hypothetical protein
MLLAYEHNVRLLRRTHRRAQEFQIQERMVTSTS